MNGGLSGARAMAIPQSSLAEFLLLQVIFLELFSFLTFFFYFLDLPSPAKDTVQLEYLYNSALWPHCQRLFNLLVSILLSTFSWRIIKSFLMQVLFTGGCLEHASFSYQWLTRPNHCSPPPLPLPHHLLTYLFWRDLSSFRWSGWAISLDILHGHK